MSVNTVFQRIFGAVTRRPKPVTGAPIAQIQEILREALADCCGVQANRLVYRIDGASKPSELWALRSDVHQCIATAHTESVAAVRINKLSEVFTGWIPAAQLSKVHPDFKPSGK